MADSTPDPRAVYRLALSRREWLDLVGLARAGLTALQADGIDLDPSETLADALARAGRALGALAERIDQAARQDARRTARAARKKGGA